MDALSNSNFAVAARPQFGSSATVEIEFQRALIRFTRRVRQRAGAGRPRSPQGDPRIAERPSHDRGSPTRQEATPVFFTIRPRCSAIFGSDQYRARSRHPPGANTDGTDHGSAQLRHPPGSADEWHLDRSVGVPAGSEAGSRTVRLRRFVSIRSRPSPRGRPDRVSRIEGRGQSASAVTREVAYSQSARFAAATIP